MRASSSSGLAANGTPAERLSNVSSESSRKGLHASSMHRNSSRTISCAAGSARSSSTVTAAPVPSAVNDAVETVTLRPP